MIAEIHIRRAFPFDAGPLSALIAGRGDRPDAVLLRQDIVGPAIWHLAERRGAFQAAQRIGPHADLPADHVEIATFATSDEPGRVAASALFAATRKAARGRGLAAVIAFVRADAEGPRAYYRSRGFEAIGYLRGEGSAPDRIMKRHAL